MGLVQSGPRCVRVEPNVAHAAPEQVQLAQAGQGHKLAAVGHRLAEAGHRPVAPERAVTEPVVRRL